MKHIFLLVFLIFIGPAGQAQNAQRSVKNTKTGTELDTIIRRSVSAFMSNKSRVGLSIGVISGGCMYTYNFGTTSKDKEELPTENSVYELASITKTFSSALLARAIIEKKVRLDDDIRQYLYGDYPNLVYNGMPVRLVNLANLTSGLPNWMPDSKDIFSKADPDSIPFILDAIHKKYTRADFYRELHGVKLDTVPGAVTRHCNTAAQLLGFIMERVYGAPMKVLLARYFTAPLKMNSTVLLTAGKLPKALVQGYDGKGRKMPFIVWEDLQVAASIGSSVNNMLKYMTYQMDESRADVKLSHKPTNGDPVKGAIALNWKVNITENGKRKISHTGGSLGFSSYMVFYPDQKSGVVLLSNEADQSTQRELINLADVFLE